MHGPLHKEVIQYIESRYAAVMSAQLALGALKLTIMSKLVACVTSRIFSSKMLSGKRLPGRGGGDIDINDIQ